MTTLAAPTVKITTSSGKPKLSWNAVTGADEYHIYRSTDGKNFSYLASMTKTSCTNTGAKENTNANSAYSTVVSIKVTK